MYCARMYSYNEGEDSTMTTGKIIKQLRKEHHLTQEKLGEIVGVQKSAIAKYERGEIVNLKRSTIEKMANYFGVLPSCSMPHYPKRNRFGIYTASCVLKPLEGFFVFCGIFSVFPSDRAGRRVTLGNAGKIKSPGKSPGHFILRCFPSLFSEVPLLRL